MHCIGFNQPLVMGQLRLCTGEGGTPLHLLAGYIVEKSVTQTTDRYSGNWCTCGITLGGCMS